MKQRHVIIIGTVVGGGLLLLSCAASRFLGYFPSSLLNALLWLVVLVVIAGFALVKGLPYLAGTIQQRPTPAIRDVLRVAFQKNYTVRVQRTLQTLPDWPIRPLLTETAQQLFALKFAAQRAQEEGVPASFLGRIQANIEGAADGTWQIASKLDAVARQGIDYALIEPKLQLEAQKLHQLMQSLRQSQEGIALLTLSDAHHNALQSAETDLHALSQAVKMMEQTAL
jgi:hypothetical protein